MMYGSKPEGTLLSYQDICRVVGFYLRFEREGMFAPPTRVCIMRKGCYSYIEMPSHMELPRHTWDN